MYVWILRRELIVNIDFDVEGLLFADIVVVVMMRLFQLLFFVSDYAEVLQPLDCLEGVRLDYSQCVNISVGWIGGEKSSVSSVISIRFPHVHKHSKCPWSIKQS